MKDLQTISDMTKKTKKMENLTIYNKFRIVPKEAQKEITGGRLKGFTDINPMWRIKMLTDQFGMCGIGWKYEIISQELKEGANKEVAAFVTINLFVKDDGKWSDAIPGLGGSSFVTNEKNGLYTSDECFKMAFTDALSIACKSLGMGADIYFQKDRTKYDQTKEEPKEQPKAEPKTAQSFDIAGTEELLKSYDTKEKVAAHWRANVVFHSNQDYVDMITKRGNELK